MYQVLARKYRPKNFHQLLGQDHVAKALINAINHQRLHHAYLFTGTRGVGKTTIARILAKCLNCETGVTSEPCGVCATCQSIDAGRFIDLIEIDAASRTKVEDTRELLDNVPYAPTQGRFKVYLIDEVHMLSTHSFNALLKTLEEPPAHVKFLLATTDPQKLPITIISRCLQFVLRPLPQPQLATYLGEILTQEQIDFQPDALWQLASSAKGSVRDALSLTDQAIAFGNGQIHDDTLKQMLGLIDQADVINLLLLIYQHRTAELSDMLRQLREQVVDAKAIFDHLAEVLHQVALLQLLPDTDLQLNQQQQQSLTHLAAVVPSQLVQLYYDIVVKSRENIALANTPLQALEMCILRLLAFKPLAVNQVPNPQLDEIATVAAATITAASHSTGNALGLPPQDHTANALSSKTVMLEDAQENHLDADSYHAAIAEDGVQPISKIDNQHDYVEPSASHIASIADLVEPMLGGYELDSNPTLDETPLDELTIQVQDEAALPSPTDSASLGLDSNTASDKAYSPLQLLQPAVQTLEGEWTPEKWDYWLTKARDEDLLAADELALASISVVTGSIGGKAEFITDQQHTSIHQTFEQLQQKLQQFFVGSEFTLHQVRHDEQQLYNKTSKFLQNQREDLALAAATEQLKTQPVLQALLNQNANLSLVKLNR